MNEAWLTDDELIAQGKPAFSKRQLLPQLEKIFIRFIVFYFFFFHLFNFFSQ